MGLNAPSANGTVMIESVRIQFLVLGALILRDVGTRFGRRPINYLFGLLLPIGHFVLTSVVWTVLKKPVPLGTSTLIFFATGLLPYIVWAFPYRQIALAVNANRPLLYFPRVKIIDIMVARSTLEVVTGFAVILIVLFMVVAAGEDLHPRDSFLTFTGLIASMYFGVAFGMLNGIVAAVYPPWQLPMMLFFTSDVVRERRGIHDQYGTSALSRLARAQPSVAMRRMDPGGLLLGLPLRGPRSDVRDWALDCAHRHRADDREADARPHPAGMRSPSIPRLSPDRDDWTVR